MPGLQFIEGFLLSLSLLIALGPKDVFVIKNSLTGQNAIVLVVICACSDMLLIFLGVAGLGTLIIANRWLMISAMVLSIGYLSYFGIQALRSAITGARQQVNLGAAQSKVALRSQVMKGALFHSLLTPYAWLDTVLVLGSISATKLDTAKVAFAVGAMSASFVWFVFLTASARLAAPLFRSRRTWQGLDLVVALSMLIIAAMLIADYPWRTP